MCYRCGEPVRVEYKLGFNDTCPKCGADVHVCKMCRFFDSRLHWECAETVDEHVVEKESRNHCEWFEMAENFKSGSPVDARGARGARGAREAEKSEKARRDFEGLFGS